MYRLGLRGIIEDCTPRAAWRWHNIMGALNPKCWSYSPAGWAELAAIPRPPEPTPALMPPDLRIVPRDEQDARATIDAIIAQNKAAQDQQLLEFFRRVPEIPPEAVPSPPWWLWLGVGGLGIWAIASRSRGRA